MPASLFASLPIGVPLLAQEEGFAVVMMGFMCCMFVFSIVSLVYWIMMLVDCAQREFPNESDKVVWILVIVLVGVIGALIYQFVGKPKGRKRRRRRRSTRPKPQLEDHEYFPDDE